MYSKKKRKLVLRYAPVLAKTSFGIYWELDNTAGDSPTTLRHNFTKGSLCAKKIPGMAQEVDRMANGVRTYNRERGRRYKKWWRRQKGPMQAELIRVGQDVWESPSSLTVRDLSEEESARLAAKRETQKRSPGR